MSSPATSQHQAAPISRPPSVSFVALLILIGALLAIIVGAVTYSSRETFLQLLRNETAATGLGNLTLSLNDVVNFAFILIGYGIIHLAIAYGLWTGQNWARIVSMGLSVIGLIFSLPALLILPEFVLVIAFALFVLYSFTRPRVKEFFKR